MTRDTALPFLCAGLTAIALSLAPSALHAQSPDRPRMSVIPTDDFEVTGKGDDLAAMIEAELAEAMPRFNAKTVNDDDRLEEAVRRAVRNLCLIEIGKKPEVTVLIQRLMAA